MIRDALWVIREFIGGSGKECRVSTGILYSLQSSQLRLQNKRGSRYQNVSLWAQRWLLQNFSSTRLVEHSSSPYISHLRDKGIIMYLI